VRGPRIRPNVSQGQSESQKPVTQKAVVALALQRVGCEIAGQQKEEAHEIGLIGRGKQRENFTGECAGGTQFVVKPTARGSVGDRRVVQDDQSDHHTAQTVDVEVAVATIPVWVEQDEFRLSCDAAGAR
jgi:hypothetical protein